MTPWWQCGLNVAVVVVVCDLHNDGGGVTYIMVVMVCDLHNDGGGV